jgi:predicted HicB family RNase H-like nuclease
MTNEKQKKKPGRPRKKSKKESYTIIMDPDLHEFLKNRADEKQLSLSSFLTSIVLDFIDSKI